MRITLIGQAAFGERVLQRLAEQGEKVVGVFAPPDAPARQEPVAEAAKKLGIPLFQPRRMRDPEVYGAFVKLAPDLGLMAFVTDIVPENILTLPKLGTIQYHPSLLPKHRGGSAINWAIIQGETRTGLTIFWPDKGIDTGPILLQKEVAISPDDTTGSLYFSKLFPLGVDAIMEAVDLIKKGKAPRIPQNESQATYEGLCTEKETTIDWSKPVSQVYNLIRGANPQPGAVAYWKGKKFKIFDAELIHGPRTSLGKIVTVSEQGFQIAAQDGSILVKRVQPEGSGKIKATEFVVTSGLKAGESLS